MLLFTYSILCKARQCWFYIIAGSGKTVYEIGKI